MNLEIIKTAFFDELSKIAATRAVKEWRQATGAGNQAYANQIAAASGKLGLKPRFLENVSEGGMEAAVDKMMGRSSLAPPPMAADPSGYVARKVYKPDSPIATGENMSALLSQKKQMTDAARGLSPQAEQMVPQMFGHQQIQGPGGQVRNISEHEFVQGAKSLRSSSAPVAHVKRLEQTVLKPMEEKGMPMRDVARVHNGGLGGNTSNVMMTAKGPKVIDFLPQNFQTPTGGMGGVVQRGQHDLAYSTVGSGRTDTGYGGHNLNQLRKDVYRPSANYQAPPIASTGMTGVTPAATSATKTVGRQAATSAIRPAATGATAVTKITPAASRAAGAMSKVTKVTQALKKPIGQLAQAATKVV